MHCRILILHKSCKVLGCPKKEREKGENITIKHLNEDLMHSDCRDRTYLRCILVYIDYLRLLF